MEWEGTGEEGRAGKGMGRRGRKEKGGKRDRKSSFSAVLISSSFGR